MFQDNASVVPPFFVCVKEVLMGHGLDPRGWALLREVIVVDWSMERNNVELMK